MNVCAKMTTLIVLPSPIWDFELGNIWDDFCEAMEYESKTGFVTEVVLMSFDKNNMPVYKPVDGLKFEWVNGVLQANGGQG